MGAEKNMCWREELSLNHQRQNKLSAIRRVVFTVLHQIMQTSPPKTSEDQQQENAAKIFSTEPKESEADPEAGQDSQSPI